MLVHGKCMLYILLYEYTNFSANNSKNYEMVKLVVICRVKALSYLIQPNLTAAGRPILIAAVTRHLCLPAHFDIMILANYSDVLITI